MRRLEGAGGRTVGLRYGPHFWPVFFLRIISKNQLYNKEVFCSFWSFFLPMYQEIAKNIAAIIPFFGRFFCRYFMSLANNEIHLFYIMLIWYRVL